MSNKCCLIEKKVLRRSPGLSGGTALGSRPSCNLINSVMNQKKATQTLTPKMLFPRFVGAASARRGKSGELFTANEKFLKRLLRFTTPR